MDLDKEYEDWEREELDEMDLEDLFDCLMEEKKCGGA